MNLTKKNLIYLLTAVVAGTLLTVGINNLEQNLENYFLARELSSQQMTAQLVTAEAEKPPTIEGAKKTDPQKFKVDIDADSAISVWTNLEETKVLFEKNATPSRPVASLSKLMTSFVVRELDETYPLNQPITVSKRAVEQNGDFNLKPDEELTVKDLMAMSLIESSNDAVYALADYIGGKEFTDLMNYYAEKMELEQTEFQNPTGLKVEGEPENHSSAKDLVKLSKEILKKHPIIFELSGNEEYKVTTPDGKPHHKINENTNILLEKYPAIIGGKTGYTDKAEQCLLTVIKSEEGYYINVVLGSEQRFKDMKKIIEKQR